MSNQEKSNKALIIGIVIAVLLLIGAGGYFAYSLLSEDSKKDDKPKNDDKVAEVKAVIVDFNDCFERRFFITECVETVIVDGQEKTVKYEFNTFGHDTSRLGARVSVNDQELIARDAMLVGIGAKLYLFEDVIIFNTWNVEDQTILIHVYDYDGNLIREFGEVDSNNIGMYVLEDGFTVEGNKILLEGKRIVNTFHIMTAEGKQSLCEDEVMLAFWEAIYDATYVIKLEGNGQLAQPEIKEGTAKTVESLIPTLSCPSE